MKMHIVTCAAPVNIAIVKYWGKRDETLMLPLNSSLSVTLNPVQLRAKTTVAISREFDKSRMWLNSVEQNIDNPRLQNVFREIKQRAYRCHSEKNNCGNREDMLNWHIHICSENNFPTSAGLASSAAGYSCLVSALAYLFGVDGEISDIARLGSGSACRSMYGGFVEWDMGRCNDGSDSVARPVASNEHWPELRALILVVTDDNKKTKSTEGMQKSVNTSELLKTRVERIVPHRINEIKEAIRDKDFDRFAEITMKESNQLHAVCLDTFPPIEYLTEVSRRIMNLVHRFNKLCGRTKVAYTFDAGPNACLFLLEEDVPRVLSLIRHFFRPVNSCFESFIHGLPIEVPRVTTDDVLTISMGIMPDTIQYVIYTNVGCGPQRLDDCDHSLLDEKGFPKRCR